jgi:hypothetical protein
MDALSQSKKELEFLEKHILTLESVPELATFIERAKQRIDHLRQEIRRLENK